MAQFDENNNRFIGTTDEFKFNINGSSENIEQQTIKRKEQEKAYGLEKYMPIGSVVSLNNNNKIQMIIGFNYVVNNDTYDYLACAYPYGVSNNHQPNVFNHDQIDKVYYIGFINNLERQFKEDLDQEKPSNNGPKK